MATITNAGTRRSPRGQKNKGDKEDVDDKAVIMNHEDTDEDSDGEDEARFEFEGTLYESYQAMCQAKRKRNEDFLKQNGLWKPMAEIRKLQKETNGLKKRKIIDNAVVAPRRSSNRLKGTPADGKFVEHEGGGSFVIAGESGTTTTTLQATPAAKNAARANDGAPLSVEEAIQLCDPKWVQGTSVEDARKFTKEALQVLHKGTPTTATRSPTSVATLATWDSTATENKIASLAVDDDNLVAKVTPERIYSVAAHPSTTKLIVAAGDKLGYVGLWNVDAKESANARDGVHLFRFHTLPVNSLEWTSLGLLSSSYDGAVRYFDVAKESFEEIFSTDESNDHYYTQYLSLDPRANKNDQAFFLSTSMGSVMHVDRRMGGFRRKSGNVTFHALCSDGGKKINSVSLHRDGYCLATGGLDRTVKLWDLRKLGSNSSKSEALKPKGALLGEHNNKLSVNSAFFSPSGEFLVATNMANSLNIYHNSHLLTGGKSSKGGGVAVPEHVIRHNNNTGRWLTTFMAQWHPEMDIFCVGSMEKPRAIDVFDGASGAHMRAIRGEALTAVASRCCFHPSTDQIVLVGGNSSGRVTIIR